MSQERVARLEALLSRVQENRKRTRTPAGIGLVKPVARAAPEPAPSPAKPVQPSLTQTAAGIGAMPQHQPEPRAVSPIARAAAAQPGAAAAPVRTAPPSPPKLQQPARPAVAEAPAPRAAAPAAEPARRPAAAPSATPLEIAVAGLDRPSAGAKPAPVAAAAPPMAPAISPEEAFEPNVIEPEPMREPARPIAQVVSRHSPQVDATFGAMLKRSLSLRPH